MFIPNAPRSWRCVVTRVAQSVAPQSRRFMPESLLQPLQQLSLKLFGPEAAEPDAGSNGASAKSNLPDLPATHKVIVPLPLDEVVRRALWPMQRQAPVEDDDLSGQPQPVVRLGTTQLEAEFSCAVFAHVPGVHNALLLSVTASTWQQLQAGRSTSPPVEASESMPAPVPVRWALGAASLRRRAARQQHQRLQQQTMVMPLPPQQQHESPLVLAAGAVLQPLAALLQRSTRLVVTGQWHRNKASTATGGIGDHIVVSACRVLAPNAPEVDELVAWRAAKPSCEARVSRGWSSDGGTGAPDIEELAPLNLARLKTQFAALRLTADAPRQHPGNQALAQLAISVTDLTSALWCGLQLAYQTAIGRKKRRTAIMVQGSAVHEVLELEVVRKVEVEAQTSEDVLAVTLINMVACIRQLVTEGNTRELRVFGKLQGQWIVGVVDGLHYDAATHSVSLTETKTRSRRTMPPADQVDSARLQVHVYRQLYNDFRRLSLAQLHEYLLQSSSSVQGLDPQRSLSHDVAAVLVPPHARASAGALQPRASPSPTPAHPQQLEDQQTQQQQQPGELGLPPLALAPASLLQGAQLQVLRGWGPSAAWPEARDGTAGDPGEPAGCASPARHAAEDAQWQAGALQQYEGGGTPSASSAAGALHLPLWPAADPAPGSPSADGDKLDMAALLQAWPTLHDGAAAAAADASGAAAPTLRPGHCQHGGPLHGGDSGDAGGQAGTKAGTECDGVSPAPATLSDIIRLLHESLAWLPPAGEHHRLEYLWQQDHSMVIGTQQVRYDEGWLRPRLDQALGLWGGTVVPQPVSEPQTWKCRSCDFKDVCRLYNPHHPLSNPHAMAAAALEERSRTLAARRAVGEGRHEAANHPLPLLQQQDPTPPPQA